MSYNYDGPNANEWDESSDEEADEWGEKNEDLQSAFEIASDRLSYAWENGPTSDSKSMCVYISCVTTRLFDVNLRCRS
jgi:hypothetical protein